MPVKVKKRAGKRWVLGKKKPCFAIKGFVFPNKMFHKEKKNFKD